jgi:hypothetical protein
MNQVADTEKSIEALVGKQGPLIDEAASEPDFWRAPFPVPVYSKLVDLQKRMARLLVRSRLLTLFAGHRTLLETVFSPIPQSNNFLMVFQRTVTCKISACCLMPQWCPFPLCQGENLLGICRECA